MRPLLELESGSNDPMAYMLTIALMEVVVSGSQFSVTTLLFSLAEQFVLGGALGYAAGRFAVGWSTHQPAQCFALPRAVAERVVITFTLTDMLRATATSPSTSRAWWWATASVVSPRDVHFLDGLTWLLQIVLFLTLGLLVNPSEMMGVSMVAMAIAVFMMLVARPVSGAARLLPFRDIPLRGKAFVSWVGLRGAVPIIFATYPSSTVWRGPTSSQHRVLHHPAVAHHTGQQHHLGRTQAGPCGPPEHTPSEFGVEIPRSWGHSCVR